MNCARLTWIPKNRIDTENIKMTGIMSELQYAILHEKLSNIGHFSV